jgi:hypothetical protein
MTVTALGCCGYAASCPMTSTCPALHRRRLGPTRATGLLTCCCVSWPGLAPDNGWSLVRWITANDNVTRPRQVDQHATRTLRPTYDMPPTGSDAS